MKALDKVFIDQKFEPSDEFVGVIGNAWTHDYNGRVEYIRKDAILDYLQKNISVTKSCIDLISPVTRGGTRELYGKLEAYQNAFNEIKEL